MRHLPATIALALIASTSASAQTQRICGVQVPRGAIAPMSSLCEHEQFERILTGPPRPGLQVRQCVQRGIRHVVLITREGAYTFDMTTPNPGGPCPRR